MTAEVLVLVFFICNAVLHKKNYYHFDNSVIDGWGVHSDENDKPDTIPSVLMRYVLTVIIMLQTS